MTPADTLPLTETQTVWLFFVSVRSDLLIAMH